MKYTITVEVDHPRKAAAITTLAMLFEDLEHRKLGMAGTDQSVRDIIQELYGFLCAPSSTLFFETVRNPQEWHPTIRALNIIVNTLSEVVESPPSPAQIRDEHLFGGEELP